ncbi:MAG: PfkB family carbohydrate kinase, partial [Myxococcota bacterium]|nr:PfkB family carbohydrate kinase [Myxococcota bacterium]
MYDLVTMGRSSIDLYSADVGAPFSEITAFNAYVGGCPTNVSVGAARLGLRAGLVTAVGQDPVGDFVLKFLADEGVDALVTRKAGRRTSAVVLGIEPPDRFPLVFYRDNCADIALEIDDVPDAVEHTRMFLVSGTGLSAEPSRSATFHAVERARRAGVEIVLDLDFRADQWHDPRAFGIVVRSLLPQVDLVIGTEEEVRALELQKLSIEHSQISAPTVEGTLDVARILGFGPQALVLKRGAEGATVY